MPYWRPLYQPHQTTMAWVSGATPAHLAAPTFVFLTLLLQSLLHFLCLYICDHLSVITQALLFETALHTSAHFYKISNNPKIRQMSDIKSQLKSFLGKMKDTLFSVQSSDNILLLLIRAFTTNLNTILQLFLPFSCLCQKTAASNAVLRLIHTFCIHVSAEVCTDPSRCGCPRAAWNLWLSGLSALKACWLCMFLHLRE